MPTYSITLKELWQTCRGSENTFRYLTDVVGGLVSILPEHGEATVTGLDENQARLVDPLFAEKDPNSWTCPPWCLMDPRKLQEFLAHQALRTEALLQVLRLMIEKLEQRSLLPDHVYAGTRPGCYPEPKRPGAAH